MVVWTYGPLLALSAGVTVAMQLSFFAVAFGCQIDKVTDFAGTLNFVTLAWLTFDLAGHGYVRQTVNTVLVTIWGVRLGLYLLVRVLKRGHDARFDEMRSKFWSFLGFWVFQMMWVWLVSLPLLFLNSAATDVAIGPRDYAGWALWVLGFLFEVAADQSKDAFLANPSNKGKIIMSGVWSVTRHPNYFGEITLWLGMFITASSVFQPNGLPGAYVSVLSPVFTFTILMFGSGVNLAEERYNKRYGPEPWYMEYRARVSPLWPFPPPLYRRLPDAVKAALFFEWPLYANGLNPSPNEARILQPPTQT